MSREPSNVSERVQREMYFLMNEIEMESDKVRYACSHLVDIFKKKKNLTKEEKEKIVDTLYYIERDVERFFVVIRKYRFRVTAVTISAFPGLVK